MTCWPVLPVDIKRNILIEYLNRIDRANLRQCSWNDKLIVDSVFKPMREIHFIANRSYITIRYDDEFEDFFEDSERATVVRRSRNLIPFTSFRIEEDFQTVAWRSFQNMLKPQNYEIKELNFTFVGSLDFSGLWDEPERIIPNLRKDSVSVKSLTIMGDCSDEITYQIVQFMKSKIDSLNICVKVIDLNVVSRVGDLKQMKKARTIQSLLQLTFEQSMELEGDELIIKSTLFTDENIVDPF